MFHLINLAFKLLKSLLYRDIAMHLMFLSSNLFSRNIQLRKVEITSPKLSCSYVKNTTFNLTQAVKKDKKVRKGEETLNSSL